MSVIWTWYDVIWRWANMDVVWCDMKMSQSENGVIWYRCDISWCWCGVSYVRFMSVMCAMRTWYGMIYECWCHVIWWWYSVIWMWFQSDVAVICGCITTYHPCWSHHFDITYSYHNISHLHQTQHIISRTSHHITSISLIWHQIHIMTCLYRVISYTVSCRTTHIQRYHVTSHFI